MWENNIYTFVIKPEQGDFVLVWGLFCPGRGFCPGGILSVSRSGIS